MNRFKTNQNLTTSQRSKTMNIFKINVPYKRSSYLGGMIISRNQDPQIKEKYQVTDFSKYGYGCYGYASQNYFTTLKEARKWLNIFCFKTTIDLSKPTISYLTHQ